MLVKKEFVLLTKTDAVAPKVLKEKIAVLKRLGLKPIPVSILDSESLEEVRKILNTIKAEKLDADSE